MCTGPNGAQASDSVTVNVSGSAYDLGICWEKARIIKPSTVRSWPDLCNGDIRLYDRYGYCRVGVVGSIQLLAPPLASVPLSSTELTQFNAWTSAGSPLTACQTSGNPCLWDDPNGTTNCLVPKDYSPSALPTTNGTEVLTFKINNITGDYGLLTTPQNATFTWTYNGTSTCRAGNIGFTGTGWSGAKAKSGTQAVTVGFGGPYTFAFTCGSLSKSIVISTATSGGATPRPTPLPTPAPLGAYTGEYFVNQTLTGTPAFTRQDADVNFDWVNGSPDSRIPTDHFSVRWTKTSSFASGNYTFFVTADDGVRLKVDGKIVIDKWIDQKATTYAVTLPLSAGNHVIVMEYYESGGGR